jgi:hypothetical protein
MHNSNRVFRKISNLIKFLITDSTPTLRSLFGCTKTLKYKLRKDVPKEWIYLALVDNRNQNFFSAGTFVFRFLFVALFANYVIICIVCAVHSLWRHYFFTNFTDYFFYLILKLLVRLPITKKMLLVDSEFIVFCEHFFKIFIKEHLFVFSLVFHYKLFWVCWIMWSSCRISTIEFVKRPLSKSRFFLHLSLFQLI